MCFSASMSLFSFIAGITGSTMVYSLGTFPDKIFAICYGFVSFMQIIDYLLWNHLVCDDYNRIVSICGMLLNHLQPIVLGGAILWLNERLPPVNRMVILAILGIYTLVISAYSWEFLITKEKKCTLKDNEDHLHWNWNYMKYFQFAYTSFLLTMGSLWYYGLPMLIHWKPVFDIHINTKEKQLEGIHFWSTFGNISAFKSFIIYATTRYFYGIGDVGSIWCFYSVFVPFLYYFIRKTILTIV